jgi:hypothetical protein
MNLSWQHDMKASQNGTVHYRNSIRTITAVQITLTYITKIMYSRGYCKMGGMNVAELPELFRLKCASHR